MHLRLSRRDDFKAILQITIAAFAPIHESFRGILGDDIFDAVYPDWQGGYREYVDMLAQNEEAQDILVAEEDGSVVGFIMYHMDFEKKAGELGLNAVHPEHQNKGIGSAMYQYVLAEMKQQGIELVEVATGGDSSHAPARRAYEKAGFIAFPLARYYKRL
jgi:predicted N-acetyltransferase YhbS